MVKYGSAVRPVSDFIPRIEAHIGGVDHDMAESYVMDSIIQFLRDTKVLTEILCLEVSDCIESYKLKSKYRITEVISVRFFVDGVKLPSHKIQYYIDGDVLYIKSPFAGLSVEVEVAVAPPRDSDTVPDFLYEEWVDAITSHALSKLYLLTGNDWYDASAAGNQLSLYQHLVNQARLSRLTKHKPLNMRLLNMRRS